LWIGILCENIKNLWIKYKMDASDNAALQKLIDACHLNLDRCQNEMLELENRANRVLENEPQLADYLENWVEVGLRQPSHQLEHLSSTLEAGLVAPATLEQKEALVKLLSEADTTLAKLEPQLTLLAKEVATLEEIQCVLNEISTASFWQFESYFLSVLELTVSSVSLTAAILGLLFGMLLYDVIYEEKEKKGYRSK